jgi:hypothetical protein
MQLVELCSREKPKGQRAVGTQNKECKIDVEVEDGETVPFLQVNNNSPESDEPGELCSQENPKHQGAVLVEHKETKHELCYKDTENKECKIYVEDIDSETLSVLQENNVTGKIIKAYERSFRSKSFRRNNSF